MPCPHNEISIVQRSHRQSAVAAAAYQSGEKLFCEYDQQVKHYPEKRGIVHNEILLPANAPQKYADRNTLWNAAEAVEKQWNSQLARRWVLTIPREIPPDQYAALVRDFCNQQFVSKGMCVDFAIHDKFYLCYENCQTVSDKLTWSHICELIKIDDELERSFYEKECYKEKWDVRTLRRQMDSALFLRLATSRDKEGILALANEGITYDKPEDIIKDTYTLEFLGLPEKDRYSEEDLEQKIIDNIQKFLLELGKGFTFVGRQYPLTVNNIHYHVDLVFYHRILKCFVLIDLKKNSVQHVDIGQMNMYMGYFAKEENMADDNPPIGIILSHNKDELLVEYATYGMDSNLFVSKYELYLPDRKELQKLVNNILEQDEKKKADK